MSVETNLDWITEQNNREVARLEALLRNPLATRTEIRIAKDMLAFRREVR